MNGVGCHVAVEHVGRVLNPSAAAKQPPSAADGLRTRPTSSVDAIALLFGESQARAIVSTSQVDEVLLRAKRHGVPAARIGHTQHGMFLIERNGVPLIRATAPELARVWRGAFELLLAGEEDLVAR